MPPALLVGVLMVVQFVLTSNNKLGTTGKKTGTWLEEFIAPYYNLIDSGYDVSIATPAGGEAPIDPVSEQQIYETELYARFVNDELLKNRLRNTIELKYISDSSISALVYPGGHGPLWDLKSDPHSIALITKMLNSNKPVATICHAGCVLLDVVNDDDSPFVSGKHLTAFSDSEEAEVEMLDIVPYLVESELKKLGAKYSKGDNWSNYTQVDGNLITGQNPASAIALAEKLKENLKASSGA